MSRAGGDPLAADALPALAAQAAMVSEALPDPAPGPVRSALADDGAARIDRAVALMDAAISGYNDRLEAVVEARMRGPKARKGTRFWSDGVKSVSGRGEAGSYAHRTEVKALDAGYVLPERIVTEVVDAVRPVGLRIVADASAAVAKSLGRPNTGLAALDWSAISGAVDSVVGRMLEVNERHAVDIRREILGADSTAENLTEAIDRVMEATRRGGRWLLINGRTLATALAGDAALGAAKALGVTHTQWLCVAGDTEIWAQGAVNVARRWNAEGLLRISTAQGSSAGSRLAVTPDHPMLTQRGWILARELHPGDHLIRSAFIERDAGSNPHVKHQPAKISEAFSSANPALAGERMVSVSVDLDGHWCRSYVDVVPIHSELADRLQPPVSEPRAHQFLALSDLDLEGLFHDGAVDDMLVGLRSTDVENGQSRTPSGGGLWQFASDTVEACGRFVSPGDPLSFSESTDHGDLGVESLADGAGRLSRSVSGNDAVLVQDSPAPAESLRGARLSERFGSIREATAGGVAHGEQDSGSAQTTSDGFSASTHGGGDFLGGLTGLVAADEIVNIEFDPTPSHVYDLQTVTGWFVANGYVIHNSRRDDRVRHTHVEADGQIRPVGTKFRVGEFALRFPADPLVLPEGGREVFGCRCSLLFSRPAPDKARAVSLAQRGTPKAATRLLRASIPRTDGPLVVSAPELGEPMAIPEVSVPADVVGYRVLGGEVDVSPGQQLSWPGALALALAPPVAVGAAVLAVTVPAGTLVGVSGGALVLAAGAVLAVASISSGQVVATPVIA
jgi:hypothetical protein